MFTKIINNNHYIRTRMVKWLILAQKIENIIYNNFFLVYLKCRPVFPKFWDTKKPAQLSVSLKL